MRHVPEDPIRRNPLLDLFLYELLSMGAIWLPLFSPLRTDPKWQPVLRRIWINTNRADGLCAIRHHLRRSARGRDAR